VSIIHEAAKRGAEFGKKILTISRKERMEAKPVNLNDIVKNSLELLQSSFPKNIEIVTNFMEDIPLIKADASQMQQVIINLAVNARDAMPDGGKLVLETSVSGPDAGAEESGRPEGGGLVKLSVSDTGMGIDKETQTRIFDPFFTTKEVGKGTGLGLYIVHSIVANHGGQINLYSEPSRGTRFTIYLPIAISAGAKVPTGVEEIKGTGTVLVIDDEHVVRETCRDMLVSLGYAVLLAESGNMGLNMYRENQGVISLVILDMVMPKMDGSAVFGALKAMNPGVKVLLHSGYNRGNIADVDELLKRGAAGFIQKPFSLHDIGIAIKKTISRASFPLQNPT
jgi:CheY-like chemotaxis protein/two-component sensor histidine kinase